MALSIQRPEPIGTNRRGTPTWDSRELSAYRRAHGVTQAQIARQLLIGQPVIQSLFENVSGVAALTPERAARYIAACEAAAERVDQNRLAAFAELKAIRAERAMADR